jgi:hypothetical protein
MKVKPYAGCVNGRVKIRWVERADSDSKWFFLGGKDASGGS